MDERHGRSPDTAWRRRPGRGLTRILGQLGTVPTSVMHPGGRRQPPVRVHRPRATRPRRRPRRARPELDVPVWSGDVPGTAPCPDPRGTRAMTTGTSRAPRRPARRRARAPPLRRRRRPDGRPDHLLAADRLAARTRRSRPSARPPRAAATSPTCRPASRCRRGPRSAGSAVRSSGIAAPLTVADGDRATEFWKQNCRRPATPCPRPRSPAPPGRDRVHRPRLPGRQPARDQRQPRRAGV